MSDEPANGDALANLVAMLGRRARPEAVWVAQVAGVSREEADGAIADIIRQAGQIRSMSQAIAKTGRTYYAQFPAPIELFALVRLTQPHRLVETGVASGVSSTFLLAGAAANRRGLLHSIDQPSPRPTAGKAAAWAIPEDKTSGWAIPEQLRSRWDLRLGRSEDLLEPLLDAAGPIDFFCHDSPVDVAHFEYEMMTIGPHLEPGAVVVADNIDRAIFETAARRAGAEPFYRRRALLGAFRVPLDE